jgi:uncharacterized lipoprotein YmbA
MRCGMKVARLVCLGAMIGSTGCFSLGRTPPPQKHFVLGADGGSRDATVLPVSFDITIGVRRLKLASYLASPFMVVRRGPNQVDFAEFHRWGEPLEAGINRVVAGALLALGFHEVAVAPWPTRARYDYVIQLDVVRFEGMAPDDPDSADGGVLLLATWEITRELDGSVLARGTTDYQRQGWSVGDYPGLVTLLDDGLGVLADDLAVALARLPPVMDKPRAR